MLIYAKKLVRCFKNPSEVFIKNKTQRSKNWIIWNKTDLNKIKKLKYIYEKNNNFNK